MNKILILLILLLTCRVEAAGWSPELRIGLLKGVEKVTLKVSAPCILIDPSNGEILTQIPAEKNFVLHVSRVRLDAVELRPEKTFLKDLLTTIDGKEYYGGVRLNKTGKTFTVINIAPLEEYLRGVVPEEMSPSYPLEALKAQAVAARSFALKNREKHKAEGFDLCATTHCQVYVGVKEAEVSDEAIDETHGEILTYKDKLIDTSFHADSGGMTENSGDVWGQALPYLIAVKEQCKSEDNWTVKFTAKDFSSRFGDNFGDVKSIKLSEMKIGKSAEDRTSSGRVKIAQIVGTKRTLNLEGKELRRKFSLPSTLFDMKLTNGEVIFTGIGRGHGVGMSQRGARAYALEDWPYEKILMHYYHAVKLKKLY